MHCKTREKREPFVLRFLFVVTSVAFVLQLFWVMGCTVQFEPGENSNSNLNNNSNDNLNKNSNDNSNSNGVCGNDLREGDEVCDGEDLFGQTCETLGYAGGTLDCLSDCSGFDTSSCEGEGPLCGNGLLEWDEECDGANLGEESCESLGFEGGELVCSDECLFNTALCEDPGGCFEDDCPLGCTSPTGRCNRLDPSNFVADDFYEDITAGLDIDANDTVIVNTNNGRILGDITIYREPGNPGEVKNGIYFGVRIQNDGSSLAVFGMSSLTLPSSSLLIIEGQNPVAFYVVEDVLIGGIIDGRGVGRVAGPGGGAGGFANGDDGETCGGSSQGSGGSAHATQALESGGGGGGNYGGGGRGGNVFYETNTVAGGSGGAAQSNNLLTPIHGGCGGGAGGGPDPYGNNEVGGDGGFGGGGGGAIQISCNGTLTIGALGGVDVGGAGGEGGNYGAGGGGGGSGGSVLLEAAEIINNGLVASNGGGGGAGGENLSHPVSESGEDAVFSDARAVGGTGYYESGTTCSGIECYGGSGGDGGAGNGRSGQIAEDDVPNSGGGGGGAGTIVFKFENDIFVGDCSPNSIFQSQGLDVW